MGEKLYTQEEVAEFFQVQPDTIGVWFRKGLLQGIKIGKVLRFKESAIQELLKKGESNGTSEY